MTFFWEIALRVNYHYSTHPTAYGQTTIRVVRFGSFQYAQKKILDQKKFFLIWEMEFWDLKIMQCQCKICHNSQNGILIVKIASNFSQNLRSKTDSEMWKIYIDIHLFDRYIRAKDSNWIQSKHSTLRVCWKKTNGMLMLQFLICI